MKLTKINRAYIPDTIMRDCVSPVYVEFHENEIGLIKQDKWIDRIITSDAIVGQDPLFGYKWRCLALDGRLAWTMKPYKTIKAAIKNAIYA